MPTVADLMAETLTVAGVKRIYGVVGDSLNGFTDSLRKQKQLDKRAEDAAEACRSGDQHADELLHRARKAGKRHRYVAELAQPILGSKAEKMVGRRKKLQDVLGDHQDSHVAAQFVRELGARVGIHEGQNGFTYGVLLGIERQRLQQLKEVLGRSKPGKAEAELIALAKSSY